ncbi:hypothetical protein EI94DRAFT_1726198 [Lactarius quietus]|nr:hypothetical protein EI94DRAFT_1726198 [Lactarius quietus]
MGHLDFTRSSPRHRRIPHTIAAHCVFSHPRPFSYTHLHSQNQAPPSALPFPLQETHSRHAPHSRFEVAYEHGAHASKTVDIILMAKVAENVPAGMACGWWDYCTVSRERFRARLWRWDRSLVRSDRLLSRSVPVFLTMSTTVK